MKQFSATIIDPIGLHARPASELVKLAATFESDVKIISQGRSGNAKSILNVMALGVKQGQEITIEVSGADEETAVAKIEAELKNLKLIA